MGLNELGGSERKGGFDDGKNWEILMERQDVYPVWCEYEISLRIYTISKRPARF